MSICAVWIMKENVKCRVKNCWAIDKTPDVDP